MLILLRGKEEVAQGFIVLAWFVVLIEGAEVGGSGDADGEVRCIDEGVEFLFGGVEGEAVFRAYNEEVGECSVQNFGRSGL